MTDFNVELEKIPGVICADRTDLPSFRVFKLRQVAVAILRVASFGAFLDDDL